MQAGKSDPPPASDQLPGDDPEGPRRGAQDESPLPPPQSWGSASSLGVSLSGKERPKGSCQQYLGGWLGGLH